MSSSFVSSSRDWIQRAESGKMKQLAIRNSMSFGIGRSHDRVNSNEKLYQSLSCFLNLVADQSV